jgi:hypothetical protein
MLNPVVVEACDSGQFHVHAVETIHQALQVFTGWEVGQMDDDGNYPDGTLLHLAKRKAREFWNMASATRRGES